ncbi:hypothetical protein OV090_31085 [Nannocystis sp. RBIL2]|uniref:hypothetical protein n=1 Tax=Nannocystis sp. RBIL2 TaxID=2996788 RepID=UPI0022708C0E|nr:hypothetical protein [Nannocystis sp. RBIL2]MCY1069226.1 hypothetical protein [Nannocystis sp. RBIL2]
MRGTKSTGQSWRTAGLGIAVAAAPVTAAGETATTGVRLSWDAPASACPDRATLLRRMKPLLGEQPLVLEARARVIDSGATVDRFRLSLRLRWNGGSLERDLVAEDCEMLAQATVVLVAVLAEPLAASKRLVVPSADAPPVAILTEAEPPGTAEPPAMTAEPPALVPEVAAASVPEGEAMAAPVPARIEPAAAEAVAPAAPRPQPRRVRRQGPVARLVAVAGYGAFPRGDFGLAVTAGWMFDRVRVEGGALVLPGQGLALGDGSGRGGTLRMAAGVLRACPRFLGGSLELAVCGAVEAGGSRATSVGLVPERRAGGPWLAFALGGALDGWFSPQVGVHVAVDGFAAPVATTYAIGGVLLAPEGRYGVRGSVGLTIALGPQKSGRPEKKGP